MKLLKSFLVLGLIFTLTACGSAGPDVDEPGTGGEMQPDEEAGKAMVGRDIEYAFEGLIEDVSGGKAVGTAKANFAAGRYDLVVTFANLPVLEGEDFYEGWIIRKGEEFDVISTGRAEEKDGVFLNVYTSDKDLTDHTSYILTVEPNDGDPAPAEHVLEGTLASVE